MTQSAVAYRYRGFFIHLSSDKHIINMKKIITTIAAAAVLAGCGQKAQEATSAKPAALVLYYSQTSATKAVAEQIQQQLGADIATIEITNPYDGDFQQTITRCQQEQTEGTVQTIKPLSVDVNDYDVIFLGYPIWFGTYAPPIQALLSQVNLSGKTIVPFCTFGSGGLQASISDLHAALPGTEIRNGYGVRNARIASMPGEIRRFLIENGYVEGEVAQLPPYSESHEVTAEETEIFNMACGYYQFPLGAPTAASVRTTDESVDYKFDVQNGEAKSVIYVTVGKAEGSKPEFTEVVR